MRKSIQKGRPKLPIGRGESPVAVSEEGRTFRVVVSGERRPNVVHIDAAPYVSLLKSRCDYAVEVFGDTPKQVFFFVELKGGDVLKALDQLVYTAEHLKDYCHLLNYGKFAVRHACVVASHGPPRNVSIPVTRQQKYTARLERCGFQEVKIRTNQLTARVDKSGVVKYE